MQVRVQGGCPSWQLLNLRSLGPKIWLRMAQRLATFGQSFVCFLSCPASPFPLSQFPLFICSSFMAQKISPNQNIECSKHFCWYLDQKIKECFDRSKLEPKIWLLTDTQDSQLLAKVLAFFPSCAVSPFPLSEFSLFIYDPKKHLLPNHYVIDFFGGYFDQKMLC